MPTATQAVKSLAPARPIESLIRLIRGQKVMLDADLAELYGVQTKRVNEAVKRNPARFPANFMFQLSLEEGNCLRSQNATSKVGQGGRRYQPYAFTEHGVVMLSSVLNSARAIQMSIIVVNAFVRMRELIAANKDLAARIEKLEHGQDRTVSVIEVLVEDIDRLGEEVRQMTALPESQKRSIGFLS
jgi:phage regulator Rha-like protein